MRAKAWIGWTLILLSSVALLSSGGECIIFEPVEDFFQDDD